MPGNSRAVLVASDIFGIHMGRHKEICDSLAEEVRFTGSVAGDGEDRHQGSTPNNKPLSLGGKSRACTRCGHGYLSLSLRFYMSGGSKHTIPNRTCAVLVKKPRGFDLRLNFSQDTGTKVIAIVEQM